jgi:hypothetical protein
VSLNFFALRKAFFSVLIEPHLHLLVDRHQLLVHAIANRVEALRGLLIQALKLDLELLGSAWQRNWSSRCARRSDSGFVLLFPRQVAARPSSESPKTLAGCGL